MTSDDREGADAGLSLAPLRVSNRETTATSVVGWAVRRGSERGADTRRTRPQRAWEVARRRRLRRPRGPSARRRRLAPPLRADDRRGRHDDDPRALPGGPPRDLCP